MAGGERADEAPGREEPRLPEVELTPFGDPGESSIRPPGGAPDQLRPAPSQPKGKARSRAFPGVELLRDTDPLRILRRIQPGDPLEALVPGIRGSRVKSHTKASRLNGVSR